MIVSEITLSLFKSANDTLLKEVLSRIFETAIGLSTSKEMDKERITAGIKMTLEMLYNAMSVGEPSILDDQLEWAALRLPVDGVTPNQVLPRFKIIREVIREQFDPKENGEIIPYVDWMIEKQKTLLSGDSENE